MKTSGRGISLIKQFEGCHLRPYLCPANLWTVGYGHVIYPAQASAPDRRSYPLDPVHNCTWTQEEVDSLLAADLSRFEQGISRMFAGVADHQAHFDALVCWSFNVGLGAAQSSTLRMKYNRGEYDAAADEFLKWNKSAGRVLPGLIRRREAERALFLS
jgi:lysozyme